MISLLTFALATAWTPDEVASLRASVDRILATAKTLAGTHVGLLAVDADTGRVLYRHDADDEFMPASTLKVVTGSAALATLGPGFTFKTQVASVSDGTTTKLVLVGGGDARLHATDLDAAAAAVAAANLGPIAEIDVDTSLFDQEAYGYGWTLDDLGNAYAPVLTPLCIEDNRFDDYALPDPPAFARSLFEGALLARGVSLPDDVPSTTLTQPPATPYTIVWTHQSKPLAQTLADMWYVSDNLIAENLLKTLGVARKGAPGTAEGGVALEMRWLSSIGVNTKNVALSDGSGVSIYDRLTPRTLVKILEYDWRSPNRDVVLHALPEAGVRGTLQDAFKGTLAEGRTFAKDGARMYGRGLAGYVQTLQHGTVTFAFLVDDWMGDDYGMDRLRARVLSRFIRG